MPVIVILLLVIIFILCPVLWWVLLAPAGAFLLLLMSVREYWGFIFFGLALVGVLANFAKSKDAATKPPQEVEKYSSLEKKQELLPDIGNGAIKADEKKCPYCAELIKADAILCKHCRSSVQPAVEPIVLLKSIPPPEMRWELNENATSTLRENTQHILNESSEPPENEWDCLDEARLQFASGNYIKAKSLYEEALQQLERKFGTDSKEILPVLEELAETYLRAPIPGIQNDARQAYRRAIGIAEKHSDQEFAAKVSARLSELKGPDQKRDLPGWAVMAVFASLLLALWSYANNLTVTAPITSSQTNFSPTPAKSLRPTKSSKLTTSSELVSRMVEEARSTALGLPSAGDPSLEHPSESQESEPESRAPEPDSSSVVVAKTDNTHQSDKPASTAQTEGFYRNGFWYPAGPKPSESEKTADAPDITSRQTIEQNLVCNHSPVARDPVDRNSADNVVASRSPREESALPRGGTSVYLPSRSGALSRYLGFSGTTESRAKVEITAEPLGATPALSTERLDSYKDDVCNKLAKYWELLAPGYREQPSVVKFTINSMGDIVDIKLEVASGSQSNDQTVRAAVQRAAPFGRLPDGCGDGLVVHATLP